MSNGHDRKSMDDVLASIRRIVRAEKEPDAETAGGPAEDGGLPDEFRARPDEPLALTPDMRMHGEGDAVEPEAIARPAGIASSTGAAPAASSGDTAPDLETLRRMVREILLEELTSGAADGAVRGIIRDELMNGEIGGNISQNVLRLIQSEIAKALESR